MTKISLTEADSLASVFGPLDSKMVALLLQFQEPRSKYDALVSMRHLPKRLRMSRASLYRKVEKLCQTGFLVVEKTREFAKGTLRIPVKVYGLSVKGIIAADIQVCVQLLNPKDGSRPHASVEKSLKRFEHSEGWSFIVSFLKWHKERGIDLRQARIDFVYVYVTGLLSLYERSEEIKGPVPQELIQCVRAAGRESNRIAIAASRTNREGVGSAEALGAFVRQLENKQS